ncbi:short-subunit dehydrogenase [Algoriphagus aquaeductus]|uniref:Short-subunit dehydrogenase n=2 Tax=Algoriphagus aquaeductus TaxID=475299 RepID=A0A326RRN2_9BACT|nr:short-subunit dehydrogenase [Algoriphagus aquaeductus]
MGMSTFSQAHIVVTGAGSGIGLELIRQLYPFTHRIVAVDYSESRLEYLALEFPKLEGFVIADLSQKEGNRQILDWIDTHWSNVDFCFANAGKAEFQQASLQNWKNMEALFQLNVNSPIQLGLELKNRCKDAEFRHVITCSAMAFWAVPGYSLYGASKAALLQWANTLWTEKSGDWLSLVFPIATATGFFEAAGNHIPRAFPVQEPGLVARKILAGVIKKQRKIFPSPLFRGMLLLDQFLFFIRPMYQRLEYRKFKNWVSEQS